MKRYFKLVWLLCAVALFMGSLIGCDYLDSFFMSSDLGYSYVTLSINPSVDLVVDGKGVVECAISGNEDAEMLLVDENLSGLTFEEAAQKFAELATEAGYIDVDSVSNEFIIEVIAEKENSAQSIAEKIRRKINSFFENNGIFGSARVETFDKYLENAAQLSIDIPNIALGKLKAILTALEQNPELDLEELVGMSVGDLIRIIRDMAVKGVISPSLKEEFKQAVEELKESEFAELLTLWSEIKALREQIEAMEDGEEKEALKAQLEEKLEQYQTLKQQFIERVKQLREQFKERWQQAKEELKERKQNRIDQYKQKFEEHKENVREKIGEIKEEIKKKQNDSQFNPFTSNKQLADAFKKAYEELNKKYSEMFKLKEEIEQLKKQSKGFNSMNKMESLEILKVKEEKYRQLFEQYKKELDELIRNLRNGETGNGGEQTSGNSANGV
ncbi:MAG: hypothetical protein GX304_01370 [Clostridiales bacterium]|nr:hypothetical protein [Clostridiales bacterium]